MNLLENKVEILKADLLSALHEIMCLKMAAIQDREYSTSTISQDLASTEAYYQNLMTFIEKEY